MSWCVLPELIEAAARAGERALAGEVAERLAERTQICNTEWALGIEARSLALLTDGPPAEKLYREAIERLGRCRVSPHLARAHLVYGEWLRRQRRRLDARGQLRIAHELLTTMGAAAFAARAHRELLATGERARKRTVETTGQLTPQEVQVARLAVMGTRTHRSGRSCTSALALSSTTCTRCSPSSASTRATRSPTQPVSTLRQRLCPSGRTGGTRAGY